MEEAFELRTAARKKSSKLSSFFKIGGSKKSQATVESEQMYTKAAGIFMENCEFGEAADCYENSAKLADSVYTAASLEVEAAKAWRAGNEPERAAGCYARAIATFATKGPQRRAASTCVEMAEMYEELGQWSYALKSWERAVMLYDSQSEVAGAAKTRLGAANVAARAAEKPADFLLSITNFELAAQQCISDEGPRSERFKLKKYFLKSGLCYLAARDPIGLNDALNNKYTKWDRAFSGTIEFRLLRELVAAFQDHNVAKFEQALFAYDKKNKMDRWHLDVALKAKKQLIQPVDELL